MRIRLRFLLVSNVLLVGLGIIGFVAIRDVDNAASIFSEAAPESMDLVAFSDRIRAEVPDLRALDLEYVMVTTPGERTALLERMHVKENALKQLMSHYEGGQSEDFEEACTSCHGIFSSYSQSHREIQSLVDQGKAEEALAVYRNSTDEYSALLAEAESFRGSQYSAAREDILRGQATGERARNILIGSFVAAAILVFAIGYALSGYIHRRLEILTDGTRRVIRGDLNQPIKLDGRDEFGELGGAFNPMTDSLRE